MIGYVFLTVIGLLMVGSIPLAVVVGLYRKDKLSAEIIHLVMGCYFPAVLSVIAIPCTFATKCFTALYQIKDVDWIRTFVLMAVFCLCIAVCWSLGAIYNRQEPRGVKA